MLGINQLQTETRFYYRKISWLSSLLLFIFYIVFYVKFVEFSPVMIYEGVETILSWRNKLRNKTTKTGWFRKKSTRNNKQHKRVLIARKQRFNRNGICWLISRKIDPVLTRKSVNTTNIKGVSLLKCVNAYRLLDRNRSNDCHFYNKQIESYKKIEF